MSKIRKTIFNNIDAILSESNKEVSISNSAPTYNNDNLNKIDFFASDHKEKVNNIPFSILSQYLKTYYQKNTFSEVKYEWIEKDVRLVKEVKSIFTINVKSQKTNFLIIRLSNATEILHVEISDSSFKMDKKHTISDIKKLLMMAVCNLYDTSELQKWINLPDDDLISVTEEEIDELFLNDTSASGNFIRQKLVKVCTSF
ncbi:hypothetical protein Glove_519g60 [Diversispora epigaea]|uniref:Uncharacterized protein n=1 Tax=Diversispora epigaea TaxID=1348612 RepID=A0A397GJK0_9GLOM|nr:hypothetical protein Glove_519g60 [Diversispora epigaea]